jgi:hypothetical protein
MAYGLARRAVTALLALGGAGVGLGCNALAGIELGNLETATGDSGTPAGGSDATAMTPIDAGPADAKATDATTTDGRAADGSTVDASDGGSDAGPAFKTYSCSPSGAPPFVVDNLENADGGRSFDTQVTLGVTSNQDARIVVDLAGNPQSPSMQTEVFRAYDVHWQPKQVDGKFPVMAPQGSHLAGAISTANGITGIVTQGSFDQDAGTNASVVVAISLPASMTNLQSNPPPPYGLTTPVQGNNQSAAAIEMGVDDQFVVTNSGPLQSNRATRSGGPTMPTTFAPAGPAQGGNDVTLVRGTNSVYAVYGGDPSSDAGTLVYKLPASGMNTGPVTPSLLPPGTLLAGAQPSTVDTTKIATYAATLVTSPTPVFSLFAGLVDANHFDTLSLAALASGPSLMLHDVPANKGASTWVGDSLVLLGLSPVSSDNGLNFVWVDTAAHVLAEAVGDSRLYNMRPGIQASAITPAPGGIVNVLESFWVAWIEEQTDATGPYDILYLDQVQCAAN